MRKKNDIDFDYQIESEQEYLILLDITDISFDSRESLYLGVTLPENGVLFGYTNYQTPYFDGILRGLARICRFPWTIPDAEVSEQKQQEIFRELNGTGLW